ncbi:hypothetical protein OTU49_008316, partial [Cherax quadricarinatus]
MGVMVLRFLLPVFLLGLVGGAPDKLHAEDAGHSSLHTTGHSSSASTPGGTSFPVGAVSPQQSDTVRPIESTPVSSSSIDSDHKSSIPVEYNFPVAQNSVVLGAQSISPSLQAAVGNAPSLVQTYSAPAISPPSQLYSVQAPSHDTPSQAFYGQDG